MMSGSVWRTTRATSANSAASDKATRLLRGGVAEKIARARSTGNSR